MLKKRTSTSEEILPFRVIFVYFLNCTAYSVEKHVVPNLTHTTYPGGELYIFLKEQDVALDCQSKIQSLKSVVDGKMHWQTKLK